MWIFDCTEVSTSNLTLFKSQLYINVCVYGFPGGSVGKGSACNAGGLSLIPRSGRSPGEGNALPTPVLLPGEFHGQRSLAGYSPWGCKESDITEQLTRTHTPQI